MGKWNSKKFVSAEDFLNEVARGNIEGARPFSAYGKLVTSGAVTAQVIWPNGVWDVPPRAGIQPFLVSDDAEDTDTTGTGIHSVEVHYLDTNYKEKAETVQLNGLTPVQMIADDLIFVQCLHMVTYGSDKKAVGNISLYVGGQNYAYIDSGANRCASSARMVPAGKRLLIMGAVGSSTSGTASSSTNLWIGTTFFEGHNFSEDGVLMPLTNAGFQDNGMTFRLPVPIALYEGDIAAIVATCDKGAIISGSWFGIIENGTRGS